MKVVSDIAQLQHHLASFDKEQIALVPTMGCLHEGHVSLIQKAKRLADIVVVSIYVNPLQFGANEDLDNYPKPLEQDLSVCEAEGVDFVFTPEQLYPESGIQVGLHVNDLSQTLCGVSRPHHFDGVVTVVNILFNIVRPHLAIFGEKDFQQLTIIQRMVSDLHMGIEVIGAETIRETDGLAKSSRNRYLNDDERTQAAEIYQSMLLMQNQAKQTSDMQQVIQAGETYLAQHGITTDYLSINDETTLQTLSVWDKQQPARIFIAAQIGKARLIDNMPLSSTNEEK